MRRRDSRVTLRQMYDHASEALDMVRDRVRSDLDRDRMLNLALVRLLEILGEAANRIPRRNALSTRESHGLNSAVCATA